MPVLFPCWNIVVENFIHTGLPGIVDTMRIGFIGLGNMGAGMAANLLKAGHEVTGVQPLAGQGRRRWSSRERRPAHTVAEACGGEVVITMLADDEAVEAVTFGEGGILASLGRGATHVSSSTISVALSERLTAEHGEAGQRFVAAPVFGRPEAAAAAKLFVVAAGTPRLCSGVAAVRRDRPAHLRRLGGTRRPPAW